MTRQDRLPVKTHQRLLKCDCGPKAAAQPHLDIGTDAIDCDDKDDGSIPEAGEVEI
jgi:hypothetical protein